MTLVNLLGPVIQAMGYELLGIEHFPGRQGTTLRIYIDKEQGINIDDCARVSHQVEGVLDVNNPIHGAYELEVSSPGLDRPLFTVEHFKRYIGTDVKIMLRNKIEGRRKLTGEIVAASNEKIELKEAGTYYLVPVDNIDKAHLVA